MRQSSSANDKLMRAMVYEGVSGVSDNVIYMDKR